MKRIAFAIAVLTICAASCQKGLKETAGGPENGGKLKVTANITKTSGTKVALTRDGNDIKNAWETGDTVLGFYNDSGWKKVAYKVTSIDGSTGTAALEYLSGCSEGEPVTADTKVYMAYAPGKTAGDIDAATPSLPYSLAAQSGKLENLGHRALMCATGTVAADQSLSLSFTNALSLVGIDTIKGLTPTKAYTVKISGTGLKNAGTFGISSDAMAFTAATDGEISTTSSFTANSEGKITGIYFAVPAASLGDLTVTVTGGTEIFTATLTSKTVAVSNFYYKAAMNAVSAAPYVEIGGVKWTTKNVGAEKETDYGDYFAWGETAPYYTTTGGWPTTPTWKSGKESGYAWQSYCGSSSFSEWSTPPYDATTKILKPEFDAAAQILGSGWRMPTTEEFQALYDACGGSYDTSTNPSGASASVGKGVYWCTSYDGVAGCLFCDGTNKLFFPAAGQGYNTSLYSAGSLGEYWSSSRNTDYASNALPLYFNSGNFWAQGNSNRYSGFSVRPVKAAAAPLPAGALKGEFSVSATKKVHFSQGNLWYGKVGDAQTATFQFEANQYDTTPASEDSWWSTGHISHFYWNKSDDEAVKESYSGDGTNVFFTNENDFKVNVGGEEQTGWRTLSKDEWTYLFNTRTASTVNGTANARFAKATVNSKAGVILLPDTYAHPEGVSALTSINTTDAEFTVNTYDLTNWTKMESAGAVFLPAAGGRYNSYVSFVDSDGSYWSSTAYDSDYSYLVFFNCNAVRPDDGEGRNRGCSVRLITECQ